MRISKRIDMARPKSGRNGSPTNIYLSSSVKTDGRKVAKARYGCSLSELVEKLLLREMSMKRGLLGSK